MFFFFHGLAFFFVAKLGIIPKTYHCVQVQRGINKEESIAKDSLEMRADILFTDLWKTNQIQKDWEVESEIRTRLQSEF